MRRAKTNGLLSYSWFCEEGSQRTILKCSETFDNRSSIYFGASGRGMCMVLQEIQLLHFLWPKRLILLCCNVVKIDERHPCEFRYFRRPFAVAVRRSNDLAIFPNVTGHGRKDNGHCAFG